MENDEKFLMTTKNVTNTLKTFKLIEMSLSNIIHTFTNKVINYSL